MMDTEKKTTEINEKKDTLILAIESSCDETAASVVKNGREVLSNVISSQIALHTQFGGVVPEIASRKHIEKINQVVTQALEDAGVTLTDVDAIGVTYGPGLVGALLVGVAEAKAIAFAAKKPLVGVHHIEGHVSANYIENPDLEPPFVCLIVSGGHTHLVIVKDYGEFEIIGRTRDDAAGEAFDKVGIRGFTADYYYDYTCMETLQGLSASELSSADGRRWRTTYSDPDHTVKEGLDNTVWPAAFERMERFIRDTGLNRDDLDLNYDNVVELFKSGKLAMYFGSSSGVKMFQDQGIHTTFLPFFQENGEKWLMTTPYFQVALNRDLAQDETRRKKAMKVLDTMLSEDAQNQILYDGQDLLSYSQDVDIHLTEYLKDVKPVIEENHMYIRIASNDFFSISKDVVSKMIAGEYDAGQAYQSFNTQLLNQQTISEDILLDSQKFYSNRFHASGGNAAYSVMANTLRGVYGTDVLIATGNSFTGNVLKAGYTKKMAGSMIMPNGLLAYSSKMSGAELKETVRNFVEGYEGGFIPFNSGSLPVVSGISVEIRETDDGYTLSKVMKDGKKVQDNDMFTVTCLTIPKHMENYPVEDNIVFDRGDTSVKDTWIGYISDGDAVLAEPEDYVALR